MSPWLNKHIPTVLCRTAEAAKKIGITYAIAREELGGAAVGPLAAPGQKRLRQHFQKWTVRKLLKHDGYRAEERLRHRLSRWRLPGFPGRVARRVLSHLAQLRKLVPPRVRAATLSSILNRWTTDRRMKALRRGNRGCILHCDACGEDSLEHYVCCPTWKNWLRRRFGPEQDLHGLSSAMLAKNMTPSALKVQAVANYVLYRTTQHMRHANLRGATDRTAYIGHFMDQQVHEAARGDDPLRKACDAAMRESWVRRVAPRTE